MFPDAMVLLVNAVRFATRRMIRNGAMTCLPPRLVNSDPRWRRIDRTQKRSGTNLNLDKDREEDACGVISGTPRSEIQHISGSVKGTRFDKDGVDKYVQSIGSVSVTHGVSDVPAMQNETYNDHEGEEDIE